MFVAAIIISCISLALFKGLKFEVEDKNCPEEVKAVETNIKALKYGTFASAILLILFFDNLKNIFKKLLT